MNRIGLTLALLVASASIGTAILFSRLDGIITKSDLVDFIAAVITALSFGLTFALAVLAINAFSNYREIAAFKETAERLSADLTQRTANADRMLGMLPWVIEAISARIGELTPADADVSDASYFRILHGRLFMRLLLTHDPIEKLDICRDIVGSTPSGEAGDVLDETIRTLESLREERPLERDLIDPILQEGKRLLAERAAP